MKTEKWMKTASIHLKIRKEKRERKGIAQLY